MRLVEDIPDITDVVLLTDWIELLIFITNKSLTKAQLKELLTAAGDISSSDADIAIAFVSKEIKRRFRYIGSTYPFAVDRLKIIFIPGIDCAFYKYFLLISISKPFRDQRRQNEVNITFDDVTRRAAEIYLGPGSKSVRFGWPVSGGRPTRFSEALPWLCAQMGLTVGSGDMRNANNDGGLDVIAWKPFPDETRPFLVLLLQSTVQVDWFPKLTDIQQCVWQGWIDTGKEPMTGIALPFVIPRNYSKRDELSRTVHLLLDRLRLVHLLKDEDPAQYPEMVAWVSAELATIATD